MIPFRLPNLTAKTDAGKLAQVQSFLYQLVEQLNVAQAAVGQEKENTNTTATAGAQVSSEKQAQATFQSVKALIIKSADIVNAYSDAICKRMEGLYVAQSDFGIFSEETTRQIQENAAGIDSLYTNIQQVLTDMENAANSLLEVNARIKSGLLYYNADGVPVYGLEIGQRTAVDGMEVFQKYARFTSDKLSFYDSNDNEVAYISDNKLFIRHVEITGSFRRGGLVDIVLSDGSIVTKWAGIGG